MSNILRQKHCRFALFLLFALSIYGGNLRLLVPSELSPNLIAISLIIDLALWVPFLYCLPLSRSQLAPKGLVRLLASAGLICSFDLMPDAIRPRAGCYNLNWACPPRSPAVA